MLIASSKIYLTVFPKKPLKTQKFMEMYPELRWNAKCIQAGF